MFILSVVKKPIAGTKLWVTNTHLNILLHNLVTLRYSFLNNLVPCIELMFMLDVGLV